MEHHLPLGNGGVYSTEYQHIPAIEPVVNGGNGGLTFEDEVSYLNSFPLGYRFKPLDSELIDVYLARRVRKLPLPPNKIHEVKLYNFNPDDLAAGYEAAGDKEWYFFTPRDRKYKNGYRPNRAGGDGYWKATGADRTVKLHDRKIGSRKSLVFHRGKATKGNKTDWIMHEFSFDGAPKIACGRNDMLLDECVLCRLYKKQAQQPKEESPDTSLIRDDEERQKEKEREAEAEAEADVPVPLVEANNQQQFQSDQPNLLPKQPHQQALNIGGYYDMGDQNGSQFLINSFLDGVGDCNFYDDMPDAVAYPDFDTQMLQLLNGMTNQEDGLHWSSPPHQMVSPGQLPPPPPPPPPPTPPCEGDNHSSGEDQK